jgi:hypothetical protein
MHERLERATYYKEPLPLPFMHNCREQVRENYEDYDGCRQVHRVGDFPNVPLDTRGTKLRERPTNCFVCAARRL